MYARVIPSLIFPNFPKPLLYRIPEHFHSSLSLGRVVLIPFRKKTIEGVIESFTEETFLPDEKLRDILLHPIEHLQINHLQLDLVHWISEYYATPISVVLKAFLPHFPKKKFHGESKTHVHHAVVQRNEKSSYDWTKIRRKSPSKPFLFCFRSIEDKFQLYRSIVRENINNGLNTLILVPELSSLLLYQEFLSGLCPITTITATISKRQFLEAWDAIAQLSPQIIIGTKISVFAPFQRLGTILLDKEDSDSHKQWDGSLRYDTRTIAPYLSLLYNCQFLLSTHCPRVETFFMIREKNLSLIPSQTPAKTLQKQMISFVHDHMVYPYLSRTSVAAIEKAKARQERIVLFFNRKGIARSLYCSDCQSEIRCESCKNILILSHNGKIQTLFCQNCKKHTSLANGCSICSGANLRHRGIGIEYLKKIFSSSLNLSTVAIDASTRLSDEEVQNAQMILCTKAGLNRSHWQNVSVIILGCLDFELSVPDFRSTERVIQLIGEIEMKACRESKSIREFLIQGFLTEHPIIHALQTGILTPIYLHELAYRETLCYPPFSALIKFTKKIRGQQKEKKQEYETFREALSLACKLKNIAPIDIIGPFQPMRENDNMSMGFLLKLRVEDAKMLQGIAETLPKGWNIDRDPIEI
jgi:primosomal protein N' (replication factor Y)